MSAIDLALRYAIISVACQLACAWAQAFHAPWPLADAFELAPTVEEQLFRSLGVRFGRFCFRAGWLFFASAVDGCLPPTLGGSFSLASAFATKRSSGSCQGMSAGRG